MKATKTLPKEAHGAWKFRKYVMIDEVFFPSAGLMIVMIARNITS